MSDERANSTRGSRLRDFIAHHASMLRAMLAVAPVTTGLLLVGQQVDVPAEAAWDDTADPLLIVLLASAAVSFGYGLFEAIDEPRRARRARRRAEEVETTQGVEVLCRRAFVPLNEQFPDVPVSKIGVHVWRVSGDDQRLVRVHKFTMEHERVETPLDWVRGRGAIGRAWVTRRAQVVNKLGALTREAEQASAEEFDARPPEERAGLTRADLLAAGGRYEAILAIPFFARADDLPGDPPVVGVLSVDFMVDVAIERLLRLEQSPGFQDILGSCQNLLRALATAGAESRSA